ncbi:MAG: hypothetical protein CMJ89_01035 [Planctomycetes bacterium]|jgi:predicted AlkP superfamily pyrophosphatase or phosphodiesterase|nr:hypothetical protein [Planctomycetota bacterium]
MLILLLPFLLAGGEESPVQGPARRPKLVVQITIDQLRADFLPRFKERFGTHGLRYLMEHGVDFRDARYAHATTFTAVGHATLFTGAHPEGHGIVGNYWLDRTTNTQVYCVDDALHARSARNLLSSTIGDELVLSSPKSKVFSASFKDRGAILPGGKRGKAFWYDRDTGSFRSSTAYYPEHLPSWVVAWNEAGRAVGLAGREWGLLRNPFSYAALERDDRQGERPPPGFERTFPHALPSEKADLFRLLPFTPFGDELLLDFVLELIDQEKLGQRGVTDMLAISFSCSDYIGHAFGPNSLEAEDNLFRLDETLSQLLLTLQERVGLENCLIVLSSDHGVDSIPEERHLLSCDSKLNDEAWVARSTNERETFLKHVDSGVACCEAGRHYPDDWITEVNRKLCKRWNLEDGTRPLLGFWNPSVYLNENWFAEQTLERNLIEKIVAAELRRIPGIAFVLEKHRLQQGATPRSEWVAMVERSFHDSRSGDWILVQEPFWFLNPVPNKYAAMHGSPYSYDTQVPVLIAGAGIAPAVVHRRIGPEDIAPTIAVILGIQLPSASVGHVLIEAVPGEEEVRRRALEANWRKR